MPWNWNKNDGFEKRSLHFSFKIASFGYQHLLLTKFQRNIYGFRPTTTVMCRIFAQISEVVRGSFLLLCRHLSSIIPSPGWHHRVLTAKPQKRTYWFEGRNFYTSRKIELYNYIYICQFLCAWNFFGGGMWCSVFFNPWSLKNMDPWNRRFRPNLETIRFQGFSCEKNWESKKNINFNTPHGVLLPAPQWHKNFQPHRVRSGPSHPKASGRMLHGHAWPTFDPWELTPCHPYGKTAGRIS